MILIFIKKKGECEATDLLNEATFEDALNEEWPEMYEQITSIDENDIFGEIFFRFIMVDRLLEVYDTGGRKALRDLRNGKS